MNSSISVSVSVSSSIPEPESASRCQATGHSGPPWWSSVALGQRDAPLGSAPC